MYINFIGLFYAVSTCTFEDNEPCFLENIVQASLTMRLGVDFAKDDFDWTLDQQVIFREQLPYS